ILQDLGRLDPALAATAEPLAAAPVQIEGGLGSIRPLRARIVAEPGRLDAIHERLDALTRLKRKYGDGEEAMLRFRDEAAHELERIERHDEVVGEKERMPAELEAELSAAATALSERRRGAGSRLAAQVERTLRALGMER